MRVLPILLVLTACGQLGPFAQYYDDDTSWDTGRDDTGAPGDTDSPADTGTTVDSPPPPDFQGSYTGTFSMDVLGWGFLPVDSCTGQASATVTGSAMNGTFVCPFEGALAVLGTPQQGELWASVGGGAMSTPGATLGMFFTFDELIGGFTGTDRFELSESGTVSLPDLGEFDYQVSFHLQK